MRYPAPLVKGTLLRRYKRFLADVRLADGQVVTAHCPNPGAMTGCVAPDAPARLSFSPDPKRKLAWTLEQTFVDGTWIGVHTGRHNDAVAGLLDAGRILALSGFERIEREVKAGEGSRLDFRLSGREGTAWVEVKGVSLKLGELAAFPDSVSERATKHLRLLQELRGQGARAALIFHVARADVAGVRAAAEIDPAYARALDQAVDAGVEVFAVASRVDAEGWWFERALPVYAGTGQPRA